MASRRLTNAIKEDIKNNIRKSIREKREPALKKEEGKLAEKVYKALVSAKNQKIMATLPASYFVRASSLTIGALKNDEKAVFYSIKLRFVEGSHKLLPADLNNRWRIDFADYPELEQFRDQLIALDNKQKSFNKDVNNAVYKAEGILDSVTTVKKLIEVWPDGERFIPDSAKVSQGTILAINPDVVNGAIKCAMDASCAECS